MKQQKFSIKNSSQAYFYAFLGAIISNLLFSLISYYSGISHNGNFWFLMLGYLLTQGSFIAVFFILISKEKINPVTELGVKKKIDFLTLFLSILIIVVLLFLGNHFYKYLDNALVKIGIEMSDSGLVLNSYGKLFVSIIMLGILPAVGEELIYRGAILHGISSKVVTAVIISALSFAIMHANVFQLLYQFILGVVFAVVVLLTKDIKLSVIMHLFNNVLVLVLTFLKDKYAIDLFGIHINVWLSFIMFIISIAITVGLLYIIKMRTKKTVQENQGIRLAPLGVSSEERSKAIITFALTTTAFVAILIGNIIV